MCMASAPKPPPPPPPPPPPTRLSEDPNGQRIAKRAGQDKPKRSLKTIKRAEGTGVVTPGAITVGQTTKRKED